MVKNNWSHAATVFAVKDMSRALEFYTNHLGMALSFSWQDPITYAVLKRADVSLHLTLKEDNSAPSAIHNRLYIFVYDIEKAYQEITASGAHCLSAPVAQDYKMTDFDLKDPDGHIISFGCGQ